MQSWVTIWAKNQNEVSITFELPGGMRRQQGRTLGGVQDQIRDKNLARALGKETRTDRTDRTDRTGGLI